MANAKKIKIGETTYDFKDQAASTSINSLTSRVSSLETNVNNLQEDKLDADFNSNGYLGIADITSTLDYMIDKGTTQATITIGKIGTDAAYCTRYLCNGTNDKEKFQEAIDALPANGGKIVILEGEYNINQCLSCDKNVIFEGMGTNSTIINYNGIKDSADCGLFTIDTDDLNIVFNNIGFNICGYLYEFDVEQEEYLFMSDFTNNSLSFNNCKFYNTSSNKLKFQGYYERIILFSSISTVNMINTDIDLYIQSDSNAYCASIFDQGTFVNIINCNITLNINNINDFHLIRATGYTSSNSNNNITNCKIIFNGSGANVDLGDRSRITNCLITIGSNTGMSFGSCFHNGCNVYMNCKITCSKAVYLNAVKVIGCSIHSGGDIYIIPGTSFNICVLYGNIISVIGTIKCYRNTIKVIFIGNMTNKSITSITNSKTGSVIANNAYDAISYIYLL